MLFNKKSMLTLFAGAALLSASSINGISASADGNTPSGGNTASGASTSQTNQPSDRTVGSIDNKGAASKALGNADTSKTPNTVSGQSDAHIKVVHGYLVLESVPSLGFQDVAQSNDHDNTSDRVTDNDTILKNDSFFNQNNKPTELSVLDARDGGQANTDNNGKASNGGYQVNASLDKFGTYDSGGNLNQSALGGDLASNFKLNLNGNVTHSDEGSNVTLGTNNQLQSNGGNGQTVLSSNKVGGGTTSVNFNNGRDGNATSLMVPKTTPAGNYAAPITWTLAPTSDGSALNSK